MPSDRPLIVFGNGLGMALDSTAFSLQTAMEKVWTSCPIIAEIKDLIVPIIDGADIFSCEEDLKKIYPAQIACELLKSLGDGESSFLNDSAIHFSEAIKIYCTKVAAYFHQLGQTLPDSFIDPLIEFIKFQKPNVATLNYDKLLYSPFIDSGVCNGFTSSLVDGLVNAGFNLENLERKNSNNFGRYMHLHGSPLFRTRDGLIVKMARDELVTERVFGYEPRTYSDHLVLAHVEHKPFVIDQSDLLSAYWGYLVKVMQTECNKIILFGYSGKDDHLNALIKRYGNEIPKKVIEWDGSCDIRNEENYWKKRIGSEIEIISMSNILEFTEWQG